MTIQYASDLHLEFRENKAFLEARPLQPAGEVLLLAGDITPFALLDEQKDFFRYVADHFEAVYWLPGNHEYYGADITEKSGALHEPVESNVFLVNNTSLVYHTVRFVFSTLWSEISPAGEWEIERSVSDFRAIRYNGYRFSAAPFNQLHRQAMDFLRAETAKSHPGQTIVVTHHVPTLLHYPPQYRDSIVNEAFATELYGFIESHNIHCWIYGHHHYNTKDFLIGNTEMRTNQLGYVQRNEHRLFDPAKTFTV